MLEITQKLRQALLPYYLSAWVTSYMRRGEANELKHQVSLGRVCRFSVLYSDIPIFLPTNSPNALRRSAEVAPGGYSKPGNGLTLGRGTITLFHDWLTMSGQMAKSQKHHFPECTGFPHKRYFTPIRWRTFWNPQVRGSLCTEHRESSEQYCRTKPHFTWLDQVLCKCKTY